jgi:hypothetical protein
MSTPLLHNKSPLTCFFKPSLIIPFYVYSGVFIFSVKHTFNPPITFDQPHSS